MASLRSEARWVLDDARAAISYLVAWKEGRGWHVESYYGIENNDPDGYLVEDEIVPDLRAILEKDPRAIAVNPYYDNLGELEEMTLATLVDGIRFQYETVPGSLADVLACV